MKKTSLLIIIIITCVLLSFLLCLVNDVIDWASLEADYARFQGVHFLKYIVILLTVMLMIYISTYVYRRNLENAQLNYHTLFNGSPLATYVIEKASLKFLAVNESMTKLYGYSEAEFLQMTALDIRPKEEHENFKKYVYETYKEPDESGISVHQKKSGEQFYVRFNFHYVPLIQEDAVLVMITDIDKALKDEKKITELINLYEIVNRATNDVIWDYDLVGDQLYWMQGFEETFGYSFETSPNNFWAMNKVHDEDRELVIETFINIIADKKQDWSAEYRYICANGAVKYVRDRGHTIFNPDGDPVRLIGAMQDIDKQKRYEKLLLSQNQQLKEIAWINSHEVRRPLSNIIGLVELIKESSSDEDIALLINYLYVSSRELDNAVVLINQQTL